MIRPHGTGWVDLDHQPVEIEADPPGDGLGPDLQAPDEVADQDPREFKRLAKDHRAAMKAQ